MTMPLKIVTLESEVPAMISTFFPGTKVPALLKGKSLVAAAPSRYTRRADDSRFAAFITRTAMSWFSRPTSVPSTFTVNSRCAGGMGRVRSPTSVLQWRETDHRSRLESAEVVEFVERGHFDVERWIAVDPETHQRQ